MITIEFIKLTAIQGDRMKPVWFRVDLITRIALGLDNVTYLDYLESGETSTYKVLEKPEEIILEIEKTNICQLFMKNNKETPAQITERALRISKLQ